jgi:hypothetical protein
MAENGGDDDIVVGRNVWTYNDCDGPLSNPIATIAEQHKTIELTVTMNQLMVKWNLCDPSSYVLEHMKSIHLLRSITRQDVRRYTIPLCTLSCRKEILSSTPRCMKQNHTIAGHFDAERSMRNQFQFNIVDKDQHVIYSFC